MKIQDDWSDEAMNFFEKCISQAVEVFFKPDPDIHDEEISFGELIVDKGNGEEINVVQELLNNKLAVKVPSEKFLTLYNTTLSAVTERWNDNFRSGGVLNLTDFVMVGSIAETTVTELSPFYRAKRLRAADLEKEEINLANAEREMSQMKVIEWLKNAEKIPDAIPDDFNPKDRDLLKPVREPFEDESPPAMLSPTKIIDIPIRSALNESFRSRSSFRPDSPFFPISRPYQPYIHSPVRINQEAAAVVEPTPCSSRQIDRTDKKDLSFESFKQKMEQSKKSPKKNKLLTKMNQCINM